MMSSLSPNNADFLPQFKAIGQSLKKRFFRKPNVSDAVEQYETLCMELQREGQKEFAGICALEAAKCQESLQNHIAQANLLLKAATLLLDARNSQNLFVNETAESLNDRIGGLSHGYLQLSVQSLNQAAKIFKGQKYYGLSLVVSLKAGDTLFKEGDFGEALMYFKNGLDLANAHFTLADQLVIVEEIVKCKVKMTELESASRIVTEYLNRVKKEMTGEFGRELLQSVFLRFEIMRVCLILLVGSADMVRFIWPESSTNTPEDNVSTEDCPENEERNKVHLYLKSLVLAVQHGSVDDINAVRDHLAPILNQTQHDLFHSLIQMQL